jgi:hypothetical protein
MHEIQLQGSSQPRNQEAAGISGFEARTEPTCPLIYVVSTQPACSRQQLSQTIVDA